MKRACEATAELVGHVSRDECTTFDDDASINNKVTVNTVLDVDYNDRALAKRVGARWDAGISRWFVPAGHSLCNFREWIPSSGDGMDRKVRKGMWYKDWEGIVSK